MYAIYENDIFIEKYAITAFEARKFCVERSQQKLKELDPNAKQVTPLWLGTKPESAGYWLVYGFPGPNENLIHIIRFVKGWFSNELTSIIEYSIFYKSIERVESVVNSVSHHEIVKSEIDGVRKTRDISDPREALFYNIEKGVKLKKFNFQK